MLITNICDKSTNTLSISISHSYDASLYERIFEQWQSISHVLYRQCIIDNILLEESESISKASSRSFCYDAQGFFFELDMLFSTDVGHPSYEVIEANLTKIKSQRPRSDGLRDLIYLSRREDEYDMCGWLLEGL